MNAHERVMQCSERVRLQNSDLEWDASENYLPETMGNCPRFWNNESQHIELKKK